MGQLGSLYPLMVPILRGRASRARLDWYVILARCHSASALPSAPGSQKTGGGVEVGVGLRARGCLFISLCRRRGSQNSIRPCENSFERRHDAIFKPILRYYINDNA